MGLSRYVPFDAEKSRFVGNFVEGFAAVNLAALAPLQIESELFGHRRGAFTGAVADRAGRLEACPTHGAVFLDEIGELAPASQLKLLRVLQSRTFERLGDVDSRAFAGKLIAATNRDLASEMRHGRLREDFYYSLGADRIETPTLRAQLDEQSDDLELHLMAIARRVAPDDAESLAGETASWIKEHLGPHYPWPGNLRELEQCLRTVLIHGEYRPAAPARRWDRRLAGDRRRDRARRTDGRGAGAPVLPHRVRPMRQLRGDRPATRPRPPHDQSEVAVKYANLPWMKAAGSAGGLFLRIQ